jgi:hypothetical protein
MLRKINAFFGDESGTFTTMIIIIGILGILLNVIALKN